MCTIYDLNNRDSSGAAKITRELAGYEGFLSTCRFLEGAFLFRREIFKNNNTLVVKIFDFYYR